MNNLYILIFAFCIVSCSAKKEKIKNIVQTWQTKEILFPNNLKVKVYGKDTICSIDNKKYKILNYIDTSGCTACQLKLYEWKLLKDEVDSLKLNTDFIFIVYLQDYRELELMQCKNKFNVPLYYDLQDSFNKLNKLPQFQTFRTFLLDTNNRVLLIGNPINNPKLWSLYKKEISKWSK